MLKEKMTICLVALSTITASISPMAWAKDLSTNENLKPESIIEKSINPENITTLENYTITHNAYINANSVCFRRVPSKNGEVICLLNKGTTVNDLGIVYRDGLAWCKISYNGVTGYVYHKYISPVI